MSSASPTVRQVAAMSITGRRADSATADALRRLLREHGRLTADTWNSSGDHLVWQRRDEYLDVSITNGEMQQQPFCGLIQMLRTHPNIPPHARLGQQQDDQRQPQHLFCDVGSGYGLAVLRAHVLLREAAMCAGVEIAQDRVNISVRLAAHMQEDTSAGNSAQFASCEYSAMVNSAGTKRLPPSDARDHEWKLPCPTLTTDADAIIALCFVATSDADGAILLRCAIDFVLRGELTGRRTPSPALLSSAPPLFTTTTSSTTAIAAHQGGLPSCSNNHNR